MQSSVSAKGITYKTYKIDIGRLIIVPLFTFLMVINILGILQEIEALQPVSTIKASKLIHHVLIVCFYSLVVFLYFIRNSAKSTTKSFVAKAFAIVASFLPFVLPFFTSPSEDPGILLSANLITVMGMVIAISSLGVLGRSFSIIPQARSLVQNGPYKFVRHPLYSGELISMLGIVLAGHSMSAFAILCLIASLQIYRALQEEKLLADIFPEYESCFLKKARFIPGIF